jgi:hypothetical protein
LRHLRQLSELAVRCLGFFYGDFWKEDSGFCAKEPGPKENLRKKTSEKIKLGVKKAFKYS